MADDAAPSHPYASVEYERGADEEIVPMDLVAEGSILGAALVDAAALEIALSLVPADFYLERHRRIFAAMRALREHAKPIDIVTVGTELKDHLEIAEAGGMGYLVELLNFPPSLKEESLRAYAATVAEKSRLRDLIAACDLGRAQAKLANGNTPELLARLADQMRALSDAGPKSEVTHGIVGADEICEELPDLTYFVPGIRLVSVPGAPHMFAGYGFTGKTVALQSMLVSLAAGRAVWGAYSVDRPHKVLHIDFEQGSRLTRQRYQRLMRGMGVTREDVRGQLFTTSYPGLRLVRDDFDEWRRILEGYDTCWSDSFKVAAGNVDENSSDARRALDMCGELAEKTNCVMGLLAHAKKPSKDDVGDKKFSIRGSSGIYDALDCAYVFTASKDEPTQVSQEKARSFGPTIDDFALQVTDVARDADERWGLRVQVHGTELITQQRTDRAEVVEATEDDWVRKQVRNLLKKKPNLTVSEIAAMLKKGGPKVTRALLEMGEELDRTDDRPPKFRLARS
jgi:hypothetical protein